MAIARPTRAPRPAHAPAWVHTARWPQLVAVAAALALVVAFVAATPPVAHHHAPSGRDAVAAESALAATGAQHGTVEQAGAVIAWPSPADSGTTRAVAVTPKPVAQVGPVSALASDGIPVTALAAYERAARAVGAACKLPWPLLAAIGRVESDHGRFAGAQLYADGTSSHKIIGIPLNGNGTAVITDTDHGRLDGDRVYDRAVGPMQFIPSTWASYGRDGNGDGVADPFNIFDAALAAATYLCAAGGDLSTLHGQTRAVLAYNHSREYLATVLGLERTYAAGVAGLIVPVGPAPAKPPTIPATVPPVDPGPPLGVRPTAPAATRSGRPGSSSSAAAVPPGSGSSGTGSSAASSASGATSSSSPPPGGSSAGGSSSGGSSSSADPSCSSTAASATETPTGDDSTTVGAPEIADPVNARALADPPVDSPDDVAAADAPADESLSSDAPSSDAPSSDAPQSGVCTD